MPIAGTRGPAPRQRLVRRVIGVRGRMRLSADVQPASDYGRRPHKLSLGELGAVFESDTLTIALQTSVPLARCGEGAAAALSVAAGESASFVLELVDDHHPPRDYGDAETTEPSSRRSRSGDAGCRSRATRDAGARWSTAPR